MLNKACCFYDFESTHFCLLKNSQLISCDNPCKFFQIVAASLLFLNHTDQLYRNAARIKKLENYDDIVMHATALYFITKNADEKENIVSVEEMALIIKAFYKNKVPNLRLISCRAGVLNDGIAQKLANILNVKVIAPIGTVTVDYEGVMPVEDPYTQEEILDERGWKLFKPKRKVE